MKKEPGKEMERNNLRKYTQRRLEEIDENKEQKNIKKSVELDNKEDTIKKKAKNNANKRDD